VAGLELSCVPFRPLLRVPQLVIHQAWRFWQGHKNRYGTCWKRTEESRVSLAPHSSVRWVTLEESEILPSSTCPVGRGTIHPRSWCVPFPKETRNQRQRPPAKFLSFRFAFSYNPTKSPLAKFLSPVPALLLKSQSVQLVVAHSPCQLPTSLQPLTNTVEIETSRLGLHAGSETERWGTSFNVLLRSS